MRNFKLFVIALLSIPYLSSYAQFTEGWEKIVSPLGGRVQSVAIIGKSIIATDNISGLMVSRDLGETWYKDISFQSNALPVRFYKFDNLLFAANYNDGLFLSKDTAKTWTYIGFRQKNIRYFFYNSPKLFVYTDEFDFLVSSNLGVNWEAVSFGLEDLLDNKFSDFKIAGDDIYVTSLSKGVYHSTNSGETWNEITNGLRRYKFSSLSDSGFAVSKIALSSNQIYAFDYEGMYKYDKINMKWDSINSIKNISSIDFIDDDIYIYSNSVGLQRSTDQGKTWEYLIDNMYFKRVVSFDYDRNDKDNIVIGLYTGGVYLSQDNGLTWKNIGLPNVNIKKTYSLGNYLFASYADGISRNENFSNIWTPKHKGLDSTLVNPNDFYVADGKMFVSVFENLFMSNDFGENWELILSRAKSGVALNIIAVSYYNNTIYAGYEYDRLFYSTDDGETWKESVTPKFVRDFTSFVHTDFNSFYSSSKRVSHSKPGGVCVTDNNGASWLTSSENLTSEYINQLKIFGSYLFAATADEGIYRAPFNVNTKWNITTKWSSANIGLPEDLNVLCIESHGGHLFIGTSKGLYYSSNSGDTWTNAGIEDQRIVSLSIFKDYLIAGTRDNGMFKRKLEPTHSIDRLSESSVLSLSVFPNPANSFVELDIRSEIDGAIEISITDLNGKLLSSTITNVFANLSNMTSINVNNLSNGIYYITIKGKKSTLTHKFIINR